MLDGWDARRAAMNREVAAVALNETLERPTFYRKRVYVVHSMQIRNVWIEGHIDGRVDGNELCDVRAARARRNAGDHRVSTATARTRIVDRSAGSHQEPCHITWTATEPVRTVPPQ
jgi:hypothetical protein